MESLIYERIDSFSLFFLDALTYFLIAMLGSIVKDVYDITVGARNKFAVKEVFVSTILGVFIIFALRGYMNTDWTITVTFILGVIGWELFSRISTIDGLTKTIIGIKNLFTFVRTGNQPTNQQTENIEQKYARIKEEVKRELEKNKAEENERR
jgi:hypothetical protein